MAAGPRRPSVGGGLRRVRRASRAARGSRAGHRRPGRPDRPQRAFPTTWRARRPACRRPVVEAGVERPRAGAPDAAPGRGPAPDPHRGRGRGRSARRRGRPGAGAVAWTAASRDVAWRENGRREAFPFAVVREVEAKVAGRPEGGTARDPATRTRRSSSPPRAPAEAPAQITVPEPSRPAAPAVVSAARSGSASLAVSVPEVSVRTEPAGRGADEPRVDVRPQVVPDPMPNPDDAPLVWLTVDALERTVRVASTRDRLLALRPPATTSAPSRCGRRGPPGRAC